MDYREQVFKMLGIELEEEFELVSTSQYIDCSLERFKIDKLLRVFGFDDIYNQGWIQTNISLNDILLGIFKIVKIPKPTPKEQLGIDYARACGCKWLIKDDNNTLWGYKQKPTYCLYNRGRWIPHGDIMINVDISFINPEEPYYIGEDEDNG